MKRPLYLTGGIVSTVLGRGRHFLADFADGAVPDPRRVLLCAQRSGVRGADFEPSGLWSADQDVA